MSFTPTSSVVDRNSLSSLDSAEKGLCDSALKSTAPGFVYIDPKRALLAPPPSFPVSPVHHGITPRASVPDFSLASLSSCPVSPVHQGITPCTSVPDLNLGAGGQKPTDNKPKATVKEMVTEKPKKPKISRWILFKLWFNTYRKFFTLVVVLNLVGIICAATNHFPYAENHLGALVLGNLLCAILMRNELWMRFLYMVAIYGLSVCIHPCLPSQTPITDPSEQWTPIPVKLAVVSILQHVGGIHSGCALSGAA